MYVYVFYLFIWMNATFPTSQLWHSDPDENSHALHVEAGMGNEHELAVLGSYM